MHERGIQNEQERNDEVYTLQLQVQTISLGEGNTGSIGPDASLTPEQASAITRKNSDPEYAKQPTKRWVCVDGAMHAPEASAYPESDEADPQIAGGIEVSEAAAEYQLNNEPAPLSSVIVDKTRAAIEDGLEVTIHGDIHTKQKGCGAWMRLCDNGAALRYNADNHHIVAPLAWGIAGALGLHSVEGKADLVTKDDIDQMIETGNENANKLTLWDLAPEKGVDKMVQAGAEYVEFNREHREKRIRADVTSQAFAKEMFIADMATEYDVDIQQFAASFGVYRDETFRRTAQYGKSEREAALLVSAVVLFNLAVCKMLSNEAMLVDMVTAE